MRILNKMRRLGLGAVLACSAVAAGCGGDDALSTPEPPSSNPPDQGQTPEQGCTDGVLQHGALYRICFPATWNGRLVLYAHGYVAPDEELAIPEEVVGGQSVSSLVTSLGYAYATT